jgi:hypothetical protein
MNSLTHPRLLALLGLVSLTLLFTGCANMAATVAPGADLSKIKKVHVVKLPADQRGIDKVIADELNVMGYATTLGVESRVPAGTDAVLTYQDKWMWDITMYMIELNVQLRDPQTNMAMATAKSYRPSLQRKSPPEMAKEVLTEIFKAK